MGILGCGNLLVWVNWSLEVENTEIENIEEESGSWWWQILNPRLRLSTKHRELDLPIEIT